MDRKRRELNRIYARGKIHQGHRNVLKCSHDGVTPGKERKTESWLHKRMKFLLANFCWEHGLQFQTEVVFHNNCRADLVIEEWVLALEVLHTESVNKCFKKTYPIPILPIDSRMTDKALRRMMDDLAQTDGKGYEHYVKKAKEDPKWHRHITNKSESEK